MRRTALRALPLLFLIFCAFLATAIAREEIGEDVQVRQQVFQDEARTPHEVPVTDETSAAEAAQPEVSSEPQEESGEPEFSEAVLEAAELLRTIKTPSTSRLASFVSRPNGILGHAAYYAKELFKLLFMNAPSKSNASTGSTTGSGAKLSQPLAKAVQILETAADANDLDAVFHLADLNFFGNFSHPINYDEAFRRYKHLADEEGNDIAQYMVGFMYATGLAPSVPIDSAKSLLYHTFAAEQGNTRSEMTLAYRHLDGIGTPRNCEEAVYWYKRVADKAVDYYRSGPPGGRSLVRQAYRVADEEGGVYGEGASVSSAGHNARKGGPTSDAYAHVDDVMEYLWLQSSKGDLGATFSIARLYYEGARGLDRDLKLAKQYFMEVAREYWNEKGKPRKDVSGQTVKLASKAAGYLGRMFLRGEGMDQSFSRAKVWFVRGSVNGDALSQYCLGLMYLDGLGVEQDTFKAADYFSSAADQELAVAQTNLGMLFLDQGDVQAATKYFETAVRNGHILAFYYLAEMHEKGIGRERSCLTAAAYYKIAAEKAEAVWSSMSEAGNAYEDGDHDRALVGFLMAAEQGSENAQANVAWMLDQTQPRWSPIAWLWSLKDTVSNAFGDAALALTHWTRSAKQGNIDSLVKMGDYYLAGLGAKASAENAAACYQSAVDTAISAQAMWNLGWMHENGIGIEKDFHLAKRYYDMALSTNKEAYVPVQLSLFKLRWRSWWNRITQGGVNDIEDEPERRSLTFSEWLTEFLNADAQIYHEHDEPDDFDLDHEHTPGDEYWDDEDLDDSLLDTLVLGGLVAALAWLLYYRQQQRRAAEQRLREGADGQNGAANNPPPPPGQQPDGGFFPQPGHPAWNDWVAGGIGL